MQLIEQVRKIIEDIDRCANSSAGRSVPTDKQMKRKADCLEKLDEHSQFTFHHHQGTPQVNCSTQQEKPSWEEEQHVYPARLLPSSLSSSPFISMKEHKSSAARDHCQASRQSGVYLATSLQYGVFEMSEDDLALAEMGISTCTSFGDSSQFRTSPIKHLHELLEPRPLGSSAARTAIVDKMPLVDPNWIKDEDLFDCLNSLIGGAHRRNDNAANVEAGAVGSRFPGEDGVDRSPTQSFDSDHMHEGHRIAGRAHYRQRDSSSSDDLLLSDAREKRDPNIKAHQSEQWNERYHELVNFHQEFGHCVVPYYHQKNIPLALWVKRQRHQYKLRRNGLHCTLTDERQKLLEDLGFVWDSHKATWEERLNELISYRERKGHCNVPATYAENPQLATWVKCQRRQYKLFHSGQKSNITQKRIDRLIAVGFSWDPRLDKRRGAKDNKRARISY